MVVASGGYPGKYETGQPIRGLEDAEKLGDVVVFHAGTAHQDGQLVTSGGRVLGVTALGATFAAARNQAYQAAEMIDFEGRYHRSDIAQRAVEAEESVR